MPNLDSLPAFLKTLTSNRAALHDPGWCLAGDFYCPECCGYRMMTLAFHANGNEDNPFAVTSPGLPPLPPEIQRQMQKQPEDNAAFLTKLAPSLFSVICLQCDCESIIVLHERDRALTMLMLPSKGRGVATPHTPDGVAFYLDQAARSHAAGANTAAITMFRSAAEWLLEDQGYKQRMLGPKLSALEADIQNGTARKWATQIDPEFLGVLKTLGNTATHTNNGDLAKQEALDVGLYRAVEETFVEVLDLIYEGPAKTAERLAAMKKALK